MTTLTLPAADPGLDPAALPTVRAGVTVRFHVVDETTLILRARMTHPAETDVRRPELIKEYSL